MSDETFEKQVRWFLTEAIEHGTTDVDGTTVEADVEVTLTRVIAAHKEDAQRHTREVLERLKSKLAPSGMSFVEIDEGEAIQAIDAELAKLTQETEK